MIAPAIALAFKAAAWLAELVPLADKWLERAYRGIAEAKKARKRAARRQGRDFKP